MTLDDLQYIFKTQLDSIGEDSNAKLFYMLRDGDHAVIMRHLANDLEGLLPMLDCFQFSGIVNDIPRFVK